MSWSKEDRRVFENSEVFKEMEDSIIKKYLYLSEIQRAAGVNSAAEALDRAADSASNLNNTLSKLDQTMNDVANSDDQEVSDGKKIEIGDDENLSGENISVSIETSEENKAYDESNSLDEEATINEMKALAYEAAISGNIKLAYKIERAIDEIIEARDEDK